MVLNRVDVIGILYCDNNGTIALAHNPVHKQRSKHIRYHFLRDYFRSGEGLLVHIPSENNVADILTKALGKVKFLQHFKALTSSDQGGVLR